MQTKPSIDDSSGRLSRTDFVDDGVYYMLIQASILEDSKYPASATASIGATDHISSQILTND